MRDVFRKELVAYCAMVSPPLTDLFVEDTGGNSSVVSHRDISIEEVMVRYFAEVEENYPSIVANVVRTTGKLERREEGGRCGMCGLALDEQGDDRWKGELGEPRLVEGTSTSTRICHGCERSIHG